MSTPRRVSFGIACCSQGADGIMRMLFVRRRCTYSFVAFAYGNYNANDADQMARLFDKMTFDEKMDILRKDFDQIWYRATLAPHGNSEARGYMISRAKFERHFCIDDGARLDAIMKRSHKCAERVWEMPKGRKKNDERDFDAAAREFREETGVARDSYKITSGTYACTFNDDGARFDIKYFIAIATREIKPRVNPTNFDQAVEINEIAWLSAADISAAAGIRDKPGHRRAIRFAKKFVGPMSVAPGVVIHK